MASEAVSRHQRPFGPCVPVRECNSTHHSITPPLHDSVCPPPLWQPNPPFPKLFSLLQIRFFGGKTAFTECLQGFYWGQQPRFWPCILYPRWEGPFSNLCYDSPMNAKLCLNDTEDDPSSGSALISCSVEPMARHRRTAPTLQQCDEGTALFPGVCSIPCASRSPGAVLTAIGRAPIRCLCVLLSRSRSIHRKF